MAAPHSILSVESADLPTIAEFLYSSKLKLTINRLLFKDWPNEVAQRQQYAQAVEGAFNDAKTESLKVVDVASGEIVGYLALTQKHPVIPKEPTNDDEKKEQSVPEAFNPDVLNAVRQAMAEITKGVATIDHYEVTYIYVRPSYRRLGIGAQLVQKAFDKARGAGVPLTVAAEPAAYDFFVKLGFKDTKYVDFDLSKWAPPHSGFGVFRLAGMVWSL
ncbi:hypothetical protein G7Z17_g2709 [Cylindrodendrum hubeiense]|uniref:N-acetyltransferase domain-containing protein n=1 Tax=Cylindrodendrum hubeiense TaxID=595255 RepID=A0A9P5HJ85_9HYPO|nr:hypothetical protein G7Z17_g2709 [Cylindrodendrum hubeiense]